MSPSSPANQPSARLWLPSPRNRWRRRGIGSSSRFADRFLPEQTRSAAGIPNQQSEGIQPESDQLPSGSPGRRYGGGHLTTPSTTRARWSKPHQQEAGTDHSGRVEKSISTREAAQKASIHERNRHQREASPQGRGHRQSPPGPSSRPRPGGQEQVQQTDDATPSGQSRASIHHLHQRRIGSSTQSVCGHR